MYRWVNEYTLIFISWIKPLYKDQFPLSFFNQVLENLVRKSYSCFPDRSFDYNEVPVQLDDKKKPPSPILLVCLPLEECCLDSTVCTWYFSKVCAFHVLLFIEKGDRSIFEWFFNLWPIIWWLSLQTKVGFSKMKRDQFSTLMEK